MSSLVALLTENTIYLGTDTFCHSKIKGKVKGQNFCSKTFYLPHTKCCFAGQGIGAVLNQFFLFIQEKVIGRDIGSILSVLEMFKPEIYDETLSDNLATIYLFGVNDFQNKLEAYQIEIPLNETIRNLKMESNMLSIPRLTAENETDHFADNSHPYDIITDLMLELKNEDEKRLENDRVCIGGQIQITTLIYNTENGDLSFVVKIINAFSDFDKTYYKLLKDATIKNKTNANG